MPMGGRGAIAPKLKHITDWDLGQSKIWKKIAVLMSFVLHFAHFFQQFEATN